jgi:Enolase C-terminal domain-like
MHIAHVDVGVVRHKNTGDFRSAGHRDWSSRRRSHCPKTAKMTWPSCVACRAFRSRGELKTGIREFMPLITRRLYDIVQPDVTCGGGILGCRKIASIAEGAGLQVIPHRWSNGLGWLADVHLASSIRSCVFLEIPMGRPALTLEDFMFPLASGWRIDR